MCKQFNLWKLKSTKSVNKSSHSADDKNNLKSSEEVEKYQDNAQMLYKLSIMKMSAIVVGLLKNIRNKDLTEINTNSKVRKKMSVI